MKKGREEKRGKYIIRIGEKGYTILGRIKSTHGEWCPKEEVLIRRYNEEISKSGKPSNALLMHLMRMGIVHFGKYSVFKGLKALGLPNYSSHVTEEEITKAIKEFWPIQDVEKFMNGEEIELLPPKDFAKENNRAYRSLIRAKKWKKIGRLGGFVDKIVYPGIGFYSKLTGREFVVNGNSINPNRLEKKLKERANTGKLLDRGLTRSHNPHERKLGRQIVALAKKRNITRTQLVKTLTNLKDGEINITTGMRKNLSSLTEDITEFLFRWAQLTSLELPSFVSDGEIYKTKEKTSFLSTLKGDSLADLRVGNQPVEVKRYLRSKIEMSSFQNILDSYAQGSRWKSGEELENPLLVFFMHPALYENSLSELEKKGFSYLTYPELKKSLKKLTTILKSDWAQKLEDVTPKLNNLSYIVNLAEEISLNPARIIRPSNKDRRNFSRKAIKSLITKAKQIEKNES
jgi:hypothetical protein